jgi:hypothetical protein
MADRKPVVRPGQLWRLVKNLDGSRNSKFLIRISDHEKAEVVDNYTGRGPYGWYTEIGGSITWTTQQPKLPSEYWERVNPYEDIFNLLNAYYEIQKGG